MNIKVIIYVHIVFLLFLFQTDDKGVFNTSLSEEYQIAAKTFDLSTDQVWQLSYHSIDHIFADDSIKETLRTKFFKFKPI